MNPDKVQARKMVLVSALMLAVIAVYRDRKQGAGDTFHALWGVGVLSFILSVLADFAPTIAGPFAALTVLGSLASGNVSIIDRVFGGATAAPRGPSTTSGGTTASGTKNPPRPASPAGTTPAGGTR